MACILIAACKHPPAEIPDSSGYPKAIGSIIVNKCAISGCHNNGSYFAAGGLNLTTWDKLFEGSRSGAVVIPYRSDYSTLCFYTNTDTLLGLVLQPTMPVGAAPLSNEEYITLKGWIDAGAANSDGRVAFEADAERSKLYVTNRLCDVVTVVDAKTLLPMRYINTGSGGKFPYSVKVSPDKKRWYISYFAPSAIVQQYDAANDQIAGEINLGEGIWTSFAISEDSRYGFFADASSDGKVAYVDLENRTVLAVYEGLSYPSGVVLHDELKKLYVGSAAGNFIYMIDVAGPLQPVIKQTPIDGTNTPLYEPALDPSEIILDKGTNKAYIACSGSKEIKVIDMQDDKIKASIQLGAAPAYMAYSKAAKKLFVTCPDDVISFPGNRGCVLVIDALTNTVIKKINSGYQPYGIAVDENRKVVAVVNANISSEGPGSHHSSKCGEKNGNVTFIDLTTLELLDVKRELAVFPFGIGIR